MQRGLDGRMLVEGDLQGRVDVARAQAVERPAGSQLARLHADDLAVDRDTGAQVGFGKAGLGAGSGKARLGLGDVRPGHFADVEAVAGLPELLLDHLDVVALQVENGGVAQDVHIGRGAVEQNVLLGGAQGFPGTEDGGFRRPDPVRGPVAVEERLIDLNPKPAGDQRLLLVEFGENRDAGDSASTQVRPTSATPLICGR